MNGHVVACGVCGSGNHPNARFCWICGAQLTGGQHAYRGALPAQRQVPAAPEQPSSPLGTIGFVGLVLGLLFVSLLIGVTLALEWRGFLVPYAIFLLAIFAGIGRVVWRAHERSRAGKDGNVTGADVAQGVATAAISFAIVIALLLLLFITAIILFLVLCFATFGAALTIGNLS
jgi:hypothetical protein